MIDIAQMREYTFKHWTDH